MLGRYNCDSQLLEFNILTTAQAHQRTDDVKLKFGIIVVLVELNLFLSFSVNLNMFISLSVNLNMSEGHRGIKQLQIFKDLFTADQPAGQPNTYLFISLSVNLNISEGHRGIKQLQIFKDL